MRELKWFSAAAVLLSSSPAFAQAAPAAAGGFTLGGRLGFALPLGDVVSGSPISDDVSVVIPLQLDFLYRASPNVGVGGYLSYGFGFTKNCPSGVSCSASVTRIGIEAIYFFTASPATRPWCGVGLGYEWLELKVESGGVSASVKPAGLEFLNLQGGFDFLVSPRFWLGPYALLSIGQYSDLPAGVTAGKSTHEWIALGARASFDF
jgi:outer membrane protein